MDLKFYTRVAKELKTKYQKVLGATPNVCRNYRGQTGKGVFFPLPPPLILNRVKFDATSHFDLDIFLVKVGKTLHWHCVDYLWNKKTCNRMHSIKNQPTVKSNFIRSLLYASICSPWYFKYVFSMIVNDILFARFHIQSSYSKFFRDHLMRYMKIVGKVLMLQLGLISLIFDSLLLLITVGWLTTYSIVCLLKLLSKIFCRLKIWFL